MPFPSGLGHSVFKRFSDWKSILKFIFPLSCKVFFEPCRYKHNKTKHLQGQEKDLAGMQKLNLHIFKIKSLSKNQMKSDITIPEVENVFLAAVQEWSDDFMEKVWYAYLINDSDFQLDSVMVVSKAFGTIDGEMKKTSLLRHAFMEVPAVSVVKIEMMEKSVLALNNEFMVTYFIGNTLYDKKFIFKANSINDTNVEEVPLLFVDGVMVK
jgi:hypothetical protein